MAFFTLFLMSPQALAGCTGSKSASRRLCRDQPHQWGVPKIPSRMFQKIPSRVLKKSALVCSKKNCKVFQKSSEELNSCAPPWCGKMCSSLVTLSSGVFAFSLTGSALLLLCSSALTLCRVQCCAISTFSTCTRYWQQASFRNQAWDGAGGRILSKRGSRTKDPNLWSATHPRDILASSEGESSPPPSRSLVIITAHQHTEKRTSCLEGVARNLLHSSKPPPALALANNPSFWQISLLMSFVFVKLGYTLAQMSIWYLKLACKVQSRQGPCLTSKSHFQKQVGWGTWLGAHTRTRSGELYIKSNWEPLYL